MSSYLNLRFAAVRQPTVDIVECELMPDPPGQALPAFEPGAHIDLLIGPGLVRQYSLINASDGQRYVIAAKVDAQGRGGSKRLAELARPGAAIQVSTPRNHFHLQRGSGRRKLLIAGGIGITPMLSMWTALHGERAELHYAFADARTALLPPALTGERTGVHLYDAAQQRRLQLASLLDALPRTETTEVYACGPGRLLDELETLCAARPHLELHIERFAPQATGETERAFKVFLKRSGATLDVCPGQTILQAMLDAGLPAPHSCMQGVCGECETRVLEGTPLHADAILTPQERASGKTMMICCSRAQGDHLTLDL